MRRFIIIASAILIVSVVGASYAFAGKPDWFKQQELVSDSIAKQQIAAVPYPQAQMRDSLERHNLRERLLRFNKPQKIGYLYLMSFGKFVGYYVVKGKISSTQSQMTNLVQTWEASKDQDTIVPSVGADGSFGENEGGSGGGVFFTAQGVLVETTLDWVYPGAPLNVDVPHLLKRP